MVTRAPRRGDALPAASDTRARLSGLLTDHGLSVGQLARALGRDERALRRWLAGDDPPDTLAHWLASVVRIDVTRDRVTVVLAR